MLLLAGELGDLPFGGVRPDGSILESQMTVPWFEGRQMGRVVKICGDRLADWEQRASYARA
jgi:hypothetical protein